MANNNNGLWLSLIGFGPLADRPNIPQVPPGVGAFWIATDQSNAVTLWNGAAWTSMGASLGASITATTIAASGVIQTATAVISPVIGHTAKTYAQRPLVPAAGDTVYFTDLTSGTIGATAAGGGSVKALTVFDGTNWIVGGVPTQA